MKRSIVWSVLIALALCGTSSFAQFGKGLLEAFQNMAKMGRLQTFRHSGPARRPTIPLRIPERVLANGVTHVMLKYPKLPTVGNVVNASYLYRLKSVKFLAAEKGLRLTDLNAQQQMTMEWGVGLDNKPAVGKAFYDDQSALARDLNKFYEASGVAVSIGGKLGKIYALPADGILYKPAGYSEAIVLTATEDFVIYYPKTKTGQLVKNTPQMRQWLEEHPGNSGVFDEVVSLGGVGFEMPSGEPDFDFIDGIKKAQDVHPIKQEATGDFGDFEEVLMGPAKPALTSAKLRAGNQTDIAFFREMGSFEGKWAFLHNEKHYTNQNQLGQDLAKFYADYPSQIPQVYNHPSNAKFYVYELPVKGIVYAEEGNPNIRTLNPNTDVVLYNERVGGQIVDRSVLENKIFFEDVEVK